MQKNYAIENAWRQKAKSGIQILMLLLCFGFIAPQANAAYETVTIDGVEYVLTGTQWTLTNFTSSAPETVTIPESITHNGQTLPVGSFKAQTYALRYIPGVKHLIIKANIDSMGTYVFAYSLLETVSLPNSMHKIPDGTFRGCESLTSVKWPDHITEIGEYAFYDCKNLSMSLNFPYVEKIGERAFDSCDAITEVEIGPKLKSIGLLAFGYMRSLSSFSIMAPEPPAFYDGAGYIFSNPSATLKVPAGSIDKYLSNAYWNIFPTIATLTDYIIISPDELSLQRTQKATLKIDANIGGNAASYTLTSSDTNVATVATDGTVTATGTGRAIITATCQNGKTATCTINVRELVMPSSVTISQRTLTIYENRQTSLTARMTPDDVIGGITWNSSNPDVATVDDNGNVTAKTPGNAVITAASAIAPEVKATCDVTVLKYYVPQQIAIAPATVSIEYDETATLTATVMPELASQEVSWTSANSRIATVNNGIVSGVYPGTTTITARSKENPELTATCQVTVTATPKTLAFDISQIVMTEQSLRTIRVTATPSFASLDITAVSSAPSSVTVRDIRISGNSASIELYAAQSGTARITASTSDGKSQAVCEVTVPVKTRSITITPSDLGMNIGDTEKLAAEAFPAGAPQAFTWSSSNTNIVSIDQQGNIKALAPGTVYINASANDGSNVTGTATIRVLEPQISYRLAEDEKSYYLRYTRDLSGSFEIPAKYEGLPVTGIDKYAFESSPDLTSLTIAGSVTDFDPYSFSGMSKLKAMTFADSDSEMNYTTDRYSSTPLLYIPSSIEYLYMGREVKGNFLCGLSKLKTLIIGDRVKTLNPSTFENSLNLKSLTIGLNVRTTSNIFGYGKNDVKIVKTIWLSNTVPSGWENVVGKYNYVGNGNYASSGMKGTIEMKFLSSKFDADGVTYVMEDRERQTLVAIDCNYAQPFTPTYVPDKIMDMGLEFSVIRINPATFAENEHISELAVGDNIKAIQDSAFAGCVNLAQFDIPDGVRLLGSSAFTGCKNLQSVSIGESVESIDHDTFRDCESLKEISIPSNVTSIGNGAFTNCSALSALTIEDRLSTLEIGYGEHRNSLGTVSSIEPMFKNSPLKTLYIGGDINYNASQEFGYSPFYANESIESATIVGNETEIPDYEFYDCSNLRTVKIGDNVEKIGAFSFKRCVALNEFDFGKSVKSIGEEAFADCREMTILRSHAEIPPVCGNAAFSDIIRNCSLYVPPFCKIPYQNSPGWKEFFRIAEFDPAGIDDIIIDDDSNSMAEEYDVYSIDGRLIRKGAPDLTGLPAGIYIINGKKTIIQ